MTGRDIFIELHPMVPILAEQQWFWTKRWQESEHEADADVAAGHVSTFDSSDDFLNALDKKP